MKRTAAAFCVVAATVAATAAQERDKPAGVPHQDHVFVIVMENHGYQQIINNPNEPFLNSLIVNGKVSLAKNYFAIGHPSLTNYFEIVGGSNFGVRSDNPPNWGSTSCTPNIQSGILNADAVAAPPAGVQIETVAVWPSVRSRASVQTAQRLLSTPGTKSCPECSISWRTLTA